MRNVSPDKEKGNTTLTTGEGVDICHSQGQVVSLLIRYGRNLKPIRQLYIPRQLHTRYTHLEC